MTLLLIGSKFSERIFESCVVEIPNATAKSLKVKISFFAISSKTLALFIIGILNKSNTEVKFILNNLQVFYELDLNQFLLNFF